MNHLPGLVFISDNRSDAACAAAAHLMSLGYRVALNNRGGADIAGAESTDLDLTDDDALSAWFAGCGDALCGVIHPAPPPVCASVASATEAEWQAAFNGGALASMMLTRTAGGRLARLGRGALIFLGSIHAEKPMGYGFLFSMGCSATQMLCREAALDLGSRGVNCFYVQCGIMENDLIHANNLTNIYHAVPLRYPKKQLPRPGSLNDLLAFLLTDGAAPLNGADLRADDGLTLFYGHRREEADPT